MNNWTNRIRRYIYNGLTFSRSQDIAAALLAEVYVIQRWKELGVSGENGTPLRLAIFGGGDHSAWLSLLTLNRINPAPEVCIVLDDHPDSERTFWNLSACKPGPLPEDIDAILISSDTASEKMKERCAALYGTEIKIIELYEGLPKGPYPKL